MADRYDEGERYGRDYDRYAERDYDWRTRRGYGYGDYGQEYERSQPVRRSYGYGDYGQEDEPPFDREWEHERRPLTRRHYGYGNYGQEYEPRYRPEREYEPDWQSRRGYGYGDYDQGYQRRYRSERDYSRFTEPTWTYTEVWLIPGPATGMGPQGYQRSNERIVEDACERLTQHGQLDARNIEIEADNGIVTLQGTVRNRREKRMAEDAVETVMGVRDVRNQLEIKEQEGG